MAAIDWNKRMGDNYCERCKQIVRSALRKASSSNGAIQIFQVCLASNPPHRLKKDGVNISHDNAERLGFKIDEIPMMETESENLYIDCVVDGCKSPGAEDHHTSPTCVFGKEAGNWPRILLCVNHHNEWHQRMLGYPDAFRGTPPIRHVSEVAKESGISAKVNP